MAGHRTHRGRAAVCAASTTVILLCAVAGAPNAPRGVRTASGPPPPGIVGFGVLGRGLGCRLDRHRQLIDRRGTVDRRDAEPGDSAGRRQGVAAAAADGVTQSVAVVDRSTGALVADVDGQRIYNTESLTKLFTAAYYLERAEGTPDPGLTDELSRMIELSDDDIQSSLWRADIVPTVAQRYGLTGSSDPTDANGGDWGSDRTTADDMVTALLRASQDPWVGPSLLAWMAAARPAGADGFDQDFGLFGLAGGVKQGWSDPDWEPRNVHSVGWTDRYFIAILQTSPTASFDTMRATSTATAQLLVGPGAPGSAAPPTVSTPSAGPTTDPSPDPSTDPDPVDGADPTDGSTGDPTAADPFPDLARSVADLVEQRLRNAFGL